MVYEAIDVANHVLSSLRSQGINLDNMKLQKILCMLEYDYLDICGRHLFNDRIEVWKYGPVVPTVYYAYRAYVASDIMAIKGSDTVSAEDGLILDALIARYGKMTLSALIEASRNKAETHPSRNSPAIWVGGMNT